MFLTSAVRPSIGRDDRGSVMIGVIGLIAVTSVITLTITAATVQALGYTSLNRASVQSQAAADAGVDAMLAALAADECPAGGELVMNYGDIDSTMTGPAADAEFLRVTVAQRSSTTIDFVVGCPEPATTEIRIQAVGSANDPGVGASSSAGDQAAVQAVYEWEPGAVTAVATGAAVFSYGTPGLSNSFDLLSFSGSAANILVRQGNINCSNSVTVEGNIVAANGNIELSNSCSAEGNVWASGTVRMNNNHTIGGNVIAVGTGQSLISRSSSIGGSVRVGGTIHDSGGPRGSCANNDIPCKVAHQTGADPVLINQSGLPMPVVPDWVDVGYNEQTWRDAGWNIVNYQGPCNIDNNGRSNTHVQAFSNYTTPTVINVSDRCAGGFTIWATNYTLSMRTDLTFILPRNVNIGQFQMESRNDVGPRSLRLITPDNVIGDGPTLTGCGGININNTNTVRAPLAVLVYTPCNVWNSNQLSWRGHYYANSVSFSNNSELVYVPIGIPGHDLDGGGGGGGGEESETAGSVGALVEYRDIPVPS